MSKFAIDTISAAGAELDESHLARIVGGKPMNRFCSKSCAAKASRAKEKTA